MNLVRGNNQVTQLSIGTGKFNDGWQAISSLQSEADEQQNLDVR